MGWSYVEVGESKVNVRGFFEGEFAPWEVVDCGTVARVAYLAVRRGAKLHGDHVECSDAVLAVVCLLHRKTEDGRRWFGYKDMGETMGPDAVLCPQRILEVLSPTAEAYAEDGPGMVRAERWRSRCWANIDRKAALVTGARFKLAEPVEFQGGRSAQVFTVVKRGRKVVFYGDGVGICRLPRRMLEGAEVLG